MQRLTLEFTRKINLSEDTISAFSCVYREMIRELVFHLTRLDVYILHKLFVFDKTVKHFHCQVTEDHVDIF